MHGRRAEQAQSCKQDKHLAEQLIKLLAALESARQVLQTIVTESARGLLVRAVITS